MPSYPQKRSDFSNVWAGDMMLLMFQKPDNLNYSISKVVDTRYNSRCCEEFPYNDQQTYGISFFLFIKSLYLIIY